MATTQAWLPWALGSAACAALTAVLAKVGLQGIDSDIATLVRTVVIVSLLGLFVVATGKWRDPLALPPRSLAFLALSGLATGGSWVCYFRALKLGEASNVAPVDKLSVVLVHADPRAGHPRAHRGRRAGDGDGGGGGTAEAGVRGRRSAAGSA